ncbi:clathrin associated protein complex medium subunit [Malassezia yamatoensis]|uniref:Clathrin associated protein complex medium subunit n=1 Tax=Malassezia yamatoensis TaxID=253288 RepID=A0AAJ5YSB1_9BASI|nr:clathrin associated protein complex medium subunit [Malassezia yamatoensis]
MTLGSTTFFWIRVEDVYIVAVTRCNANAVLVFEFLHKLHSVCNASLRTPLTADTVKKNFTLLYEFLDEMIDFGYPQDGEASLFTRRVSTDDFRLDDANRVEDYLPATVQQVTWRRPDIKYRKNECYLDVVETLNVLLSAQDTPLRSDVQGRIIMRAYLSGMPRCSVAFDTNVVIDTRHEAHARLDSRPNTPSSDAYQVRLSDCFFHPCAQLSHLDRDQTVHIVPVDGDFELMRYRATNGVKSPFQVHTTVEEIGDHTVKYTLRLRATIDGNLHANNVLARIPTPRNTSRARCTTATGKAKLEIDESAIIWRIPKISGGNEVSLNADVVLQPQMPAQPWTRPPIQLSFTILMFVASGLGIRYLKVAEKAQYRTVKWIRYVTRADGSYLIRI